MSERAKYWAGHLATWKASGLSQVAFCRQRGISIAAFRWWKRQLPGITFEIVCGRTTTDFRTKITGGCRT